MKYKVGLTDRKDNRGFSPMKHRPTSSSSKGSFFSKFLDRKNPARRIGNAASNVQGKKSFKQFLGRFIYISLAVVFFIGLVGLIVAGIYLKKLESELPNVEGLEDRKTALSTEIFDRNGKLLYTIHGDENREFVKIEDIPDHTKWALLAAEDITFYQHKGVDLPGMVGALYRNLTQGANIVGASTISQQLIKNTVLKDAIGAKAAADKNYIRKLQEALLTMKMEQMYSKDQILQKYMNEIWLGGVNYGFQAASKYYFGKDIKNLTLAESAMLAGLVPNPGVYAPTNGSRPDLAVSRQNYVLDQMLKHKDQTGVTEEEVEAARKEKLVYKSADVNLLAPHFVFYVKQLLIEQFGEPIVNSGGLKVTTTLDYSIQKIVEEEIKKGTAAKGKPYKVNNGAGVVIDPKTGDILAMVGSVNYNETKNKKIDGNVNVTISPRQMGSSVKPYTYLTAFHQGYGPWLLTPDIKDLKFGGYRPSNWDDKFYGNMLAREAIIQSRNIPAVYALQLVGINNFVNTAQTLGITTLKNVESFGLSLTLGSADMTLLEHASAYTVFANEGIKRDVRPFLKVVDSSGKTLVDNSKNPGKRVWDEKEIYLMNWVLCDIGSFGDQTFDFNYFYNGRRAYCGKTGTTNGPTDLIAMLYHKNLVVAVWNGNNDNTPVPGAWSTTVPLPIASSILTRLAGKYKPEAFTRPSGVVAAQVCDDSGKLAGKDSGCKKVSSVYITGHAPEVDNREKVEICKDSNLISSNADVSRQFGLLTTGVVLNKKLENSAQQANFDKYMSGIKSPKYFAKKPDTADCKLPLGPDNAPVATITSPQNNESFIAGNAVTISASGQALQSITKIEFYFDNNLVGTATTSPYTINYNIPSSTPAGAYPIKAIVYDNLGKTGVSPVVNVNVSVVVMSVSITSPSNGTVVTGFPLNIAASVNGGTATSVNFVVTGSGGYSKSILDNDGSNGWAVNWNDNTALNGVYNLKATAHQGANTFTSSTINIILNK